MCVNVSKGKGVFACIVVVVMPRLLFVKNVLEHPISHILSWSTRRQERTAGHAGIKPCVHRNAAHHKHEEPHPNSPSHSLDPLASNRLEYHFEHTRHAREGEEGGQLERLRNGGGHVELAQGMEGAREEEGQGKEEVGRVREAEEPQRRCGADDELVL